MKKYGLIALSLVFFGIEFISNTLNVSIDSINTIFVVIAIGIFLNSLYKKAVKRQDDDNTTVVVKKPIDYQQYEFYDDPKQYEHDPEDYKFDPDDFTYE